VKSHESKEERSSFAKDWIDYKRQSLAAVFGRSISEAKVQHCMQR